MSQVGLVLEGGGLRGVYTSGALDAFLDEKIKIPYVIGVSAGVCNAVSYLSNQKGRSAAINIEHCNDPEYYGLKNLITKGSIFSEDMLFRKMPEELYPFDYDAYENSGIQLFAGVTDCVKGAPAYYMLDGLKGKMDIVKASSWLPYVSPMVEYDGKKFLDGGISDPIPIKKSMQDVNDRNVIILTQPKGYQKQPSKAALLAKLKYRRYPKLVALLAARHQLYNDTLAYIDRLETDGQAIVLRPSESLGLSRLEKDAEKLKAAYRLGYADAMAKAEAIKKMMHAES